MKKRLRHRLFFCEYCEIFKNTHFEKHLRTTASEDTPTLMLSYEICEIFKNTNLEEHVRKTASIWQKWPFEWSNFLASKIYQEPIFWALNVNSVRNKSEALEFLIKNKFDVFLVSESKLDSCFPEVQFKIPGYRIFRQDRDKYGGGLMFHINQNIPCKKIETFQFTSSIKILTLEINLGKEKRDFWHI